MPPRASCASKMWRRCRNAPMSSVGWPRRGARWWNQRQSVPGHLRPPADPDVRRQAHAPVSDQERPRGQRGDRVKSRQTLGPGDIDLGSPHKATRLEFRPWQTPGVDEPAFNPCAEREAEVVGQARNGALAIVAPRLAQNRDFFHPPDPPDLNGELIDGWLAAHQVLDLRWIEVDAPHREHIVDSTGDAAQQLREGTAAGTGCAGHLDTV